MKVFLFALLVSGPLFAANLELKNHGKPFKSLSREEMNLLVKSETWEVRDEHEGKNVRQKYLGFPFWRLLEKVYGRELAKAEEVLFTCSDGYTPSVPIAKIKRHQSLLAVEKSDGKPFTFIEVETKKEISYGPYYLVWENLKDPELKNAHNADWPYQVVSVDLITFADRFPKLAPPMKSSEKVKNGFLAFRRNCVQCHKVNGEGGDKAIELNTPVSVTEYWKEDWLKKWITDPSKVRPTAMMPPIGEEANVKENVDNIVEYLKAMAKHKKGT